MLIVFIIIYVPEGIMYNTGQKALPTDAETAQALANIFGPNASTNWVIQMLLDAFTFAAGVEVLLFGVRMIIGEIVPAFKGISQKFIKDAKASLDCPIVYPYAPNAVLIGFVSSLVAGVIGMAITIGISAGTNGFLSIVIPGVVPHFFLGATSGVYGNVKGGIWGCVVGSFVNGLIITFVPLVFVAAKWTPGSSLSWGDTDYLLGIVPGILALAGGIPGRVLVVLVPALIYLALIIDGQIVRIKTKKQMLLKKTEEVSETTTPANEAQAVTTTSANNT